MQIIPVKREIKLKEKEEEKKILIYPEMIWQLQN